MIKRGPPRFDLAAAQKAELLIPKSCVAKADVVLMLSRDVAVRRHIRGLFLSLVPEDYVHTQIMTRQGAKPLQGDVYGKIDDHALWFIKFQVDGSTIIMSCHEAEHDLTLLDGRVLRRPK